MLSWTDLARLHQIREITIICIFTELYTFSVLHTLLISSVCPTDVPTLALLEVVHVCLINGKSTQSFERPECLQPARALQHVPVIHSQNRSFTDGRDSQLHKRSHILMVMLFRAMRELVFCPRIVHSLRSSDQSVNDCIMLKLLFIYPTL